MTTYSFNEGKVYDFDNWEIGDPLHVGMYTFNPTSIAPWKRLDYGPTKSSTHWTNVPVGDVPPSIRTMALLLL